MCKMNKIFPLTEDFVEFLFPYEACNTNKKCNAVLEKGCSSISNVEIILEYSNLWYVCLKVNLGRTRPLHW